MRLTIALPVLNEALLLRESVERILAVLQHALSEVDYALVIADNGSTDRTAEISRALALSQHKVFYLRLPERGKGRAVFAAWQAVPADVYVFMDIDLAVDLSALPLLYKAVLANGGVASGSRFHSASTVTRSFKRRLFSYGYRILLRSIFRTSITDAPCGFKAISQAVWERVAPEVKDRRWFFDTELLLRAEQASFSMTEIPVVWCERTVAGRKSRVRTIQLALEYLGKLISLRCRLL
jgi:glycosyltransferase involved in cell wall biosynthesis